MRQYTKSYVNCTSIASRARAHNWQFDAHSDDDCHRLYWISKGTGRSQINGTTRGFGPNTAIFVPCNTVNGFEFGPTTAGWIVTIPTSLPMPLDFPEQAIHATITNRDEQSELISLCDDINREQQSWSAGHETALLCHTGLMSVWIQRRLSQNLAERTNETKSDRLMRQFSHLIEARFATSDTASDYAKKLGITPTHLSRICRDRLGKPATSVIQDRTVLEARRMLAFSDHRISEIAETLGFATPAYFTRLFTQKTGASPSEFRRQSRRIPETGRQDSVG